MRNFIILLALCFATISCENKRDQDPLAGFWRLTHWEDASGATVEPANRIFYAVQLSMMCFEEYNGLIDSPCSRINAYYQHTGDELIITDTFKPSTGGSVDTPYPAGDYSALARYGVPADGRFHIDMLEGETLVLSSNEGKLVFQQY